MADRISPFVKRMRTNGGTIYTFSSAVEDIGLNINERNNIVKISHFALLDIPNVREVQDTANLKPNYFNVNAIAGAWEYEQDSASVKDGRLLIAESFQNYALNLESNLLNQGTYNQTLQQTVSERVFWKWMKETGAIRWTKDASNYWIEELDIDGSAGYNSVVKYVGLVSAGNVRSDTFGTYNETYVLIPTSHGETRVYFKQVEDENYYHGLSIGDLGENILGREGYTLPHPDGLSYRGYYDFVDSSTLVGTYATEFDPSTGSYSPGWWYSYFNFNPGAIYTDNAYIIDASLYLDTSVWNTDLKYDSGGNEIAFRRSNIDCIQIEYNLDNLKVVYGDNALTYDKMAIEYSTNDTFEFNSALIYYTVYNQAQDTVLATNLLGVMFLDAPSGNSSDIPFAGIEIPSLEKIMSGPSGFGTSFSLRLNIKTDNMMDDTQATIIDLATSDQLYAEDWTEAFDNLEEAVKILGQQNANSQYITGQYMVIASNQTQILNEINAIKNQLNDVATDIQGEANTLTMFADGEDPLVESSIYMNTGKIGLFTKNPEFPVQIDASLKSKDITIENAIRDTSGNILLGYGSPLTLGSNLNTTPREVEIYGTGGNGPAIRVDTSNNILLATDVSVVGDMIVQGNIYQNGQPVGGDSSTFWNLNVTDIYNANTGFVGINKSNPNYQLDVSGNLNVDGSIYVNGTPFVGGGGSLWTESGSNLYYDAGRIWVGSSTDPGAVGGIIANQLGAGNGFTVYDSTFVSTPTFRMWVDSAKNLGMLTRTTGNLGLAMEDTGKVTFFQDVSIQGSVIANGGFTGNLTGTASNATNATNAASAAKWDTARTLTVTLTGDVGGSASTTLDGTANRTITINTTGGGGGSFTANRAIVSNSSGDLASSSLITTTELDYLNGVTSNIQSQLNGKLSTSGNAVTASRWQTSRTISLTGDVTGSASFNGSANFGVATTVNKANANYWVLSSGDLYYNGGVKIGGTGSTTYGLEVVGTIYASSQITGYSDERGKEDIETMHYDDIARKVLKLRPVTYKLKADENKETRLGFIAQEVQPLFPELVGSHEKDGQEVLTLNTIDMAAPIVATIQRQQDELETAYEKINKLEDEVYELKNQIQEILSKL